MVRFRHVPEASAKLDLINLGTTQSSDGWPQRALLHEDFHALFSQVSIGAPVP